MTFRIFLFLFFILFSKLSFSQTRSNAQYLATIDSLLDHRKLLEIRFIVDELVKDPDNGSAFELELLRLKARSFERGEQLIEAESILANVIRQSKMKSLDSTLFEAYILQALIYEKKLKLDQCYSYLQKAKTIHRQNQKLDHLYATYCVRMSSYFRFVSLQDSISYYANEGLKYAAEYRDFSNISDANYLLRSSVKNDSILSHSLKHYLKAANQFMDHSKYWPAGDIYCKISRIYLDMNKAELALQYADSSMNAYVLSKQPISGSPYIEKSKAFEKLNMLDSALKYTQLSYKAHEDKMTIDNASRISSLAQSYEKKKSELEIKTQKQINAKQKYILGLLGFIMIIVGLVSAALIVSRNRIKAKQKLIATQADELKVSLAQKEVLMAELQHRVKNNLQMIIGLLSLQEGVKSEKTTDTILRESQNRIRSMSMLHEKLTDLDDAGNIDAKSYLDEISELLKVSYERPDQEITIKSDVKNAGLSPKSSIPIGLILVELLSNSFKHAFKNLDNGGVFVELKKSDDEHYSNLLTYHDNGKCLLIPDVENPTGLGTEIISGLVGQLKGRLTMNKVVGLEVKIYF